MGNSDRMEIGDFVLAVGSPFGLSHSVSFGIVSAKGRHDLELGNSGVKLQDFLQTDASINPGNSGGPLVNLQGEIVGVNTAIASSSGGNERVGFAIPINMFQAVAKQLIHNGRVTRAFLGVTLDATFGSAMAAEVGLPRPMGARVTDITPNSPATAAGLQPGDVILEFNGKPVEDDNHLVNLVNLTEVGKEVSLLIWRQRRTILAKTAVADRGRF
jgi:serine protease Do